MKNIEWVMCSGANLNNADLNCAGLSDAKLNNEDLFEKLSDNDSQFPDGLYELSLAMEYDLENNLGNAYEKLNLYLKLFENFGYTFDYGLSGEPYELKKIEKED